MTDTEIKLMWLYGHELWPAWRIPTEPDLQAIRLQAWQDQLGDLNGRLVRAAFVALGDSEFFPPLGKVREQAVDIARRERGEIRVPDVDEAWAEVMDAMHHGGRESRPEWSHPAIASVVRSMDWWTMCMSTEAEVQRGQFARLYASCRDRHVRDATPAAPAVAAILGRAAAAIGHMDELEPSS